MSNTEPKCVLHLSGKGSEELKTFDDKSWQKVKDADKKRRSWLNSSKFLQLQLPDDYDYTVCYHTKCYTSLLYPNNLVQTVRTRA